MMEEYSGIKFKVEFQSKSIPCHAFLGELIHWCHVFHDAQLAPPYPGGSAGNLSFRELTGHKSFIISGTSIGLKDNVSPEKFCRILSCHVKRKKVTAEGRILPSSETLMHDAIYRTRPEINAIFHGHSDLLLQHGISLGLMQTQESQEYGSLALIDSLLQVLGQNNFILLKEHGFISMGRSMKEAGENALMMLRRLEEITQAGKNG